MAGRYKHSIILKFKELWKISSYQTKCGYSERTQPSTDVLLRQQKSVVWQMCHKYTLKKGTEQWIVFFLSIIVREFTHCEKPQLQERERERDHSGLLDCGKATSKLHYVKITRSLNKNYGWIKYELVPPGSSIWNGSIEKNYCWIKHELAPPGLSIRKGRKWERQSHIHVAVNAWAVCITTAWLKEGPTWNSNNITIFSCSWCCCALKQQQQISFLAW